MDGTITRDLFMVNPELFPPKHPDEVKPAPTTTSAPATAPATDVRELEQKLVHSEAQDLELESTMVGQCSIASINGKILRVGEWLSGFEVVEITTRSCTVRKKGVPVVLEIKK